MTANEDFLKNTPLNKLDSITRQINLWADKPELRSLYLPTDVTLTVHEIENHIMEELEKFESKPLSALTVNALIDALQTTALREGYDDNNENGPIYYDFTSEDYADELLRRFKKLELIALMREHNTPETVKESEHGRYVESEPFDSLEHGIKPARVQHKPALRAPGTGQIKPPPPAQ